MPQEAAVLLWTGCDESRGPIAGRAPRATTRAERQDGRARHPRAARERRAVARPRQRLQVPGDDDAAHEHRFTLENLTNLGACPRRELDRAGVARGTGGLGSAVDGVRPDPVTRPPVRCILERSFTSTWTSSSRPSRCCGVRSPRKPVVVGGDGDPTKRGVDHRELRGAEVRDRLGDAAVDRVQAEPRRGGGRARVPGGVGRGRRALPAVVEVRRTRRSWHPGP